MTTDFIKYLSQVKDAPKPIKPKPPQAPVVESESVAVIKAEKLSHLEKLKIQNPEAYNKIVSLQ